MNEPVIAGKKPCILELEPGTYWWCTCGRSASQPFCDGSHKLTDFSPMEVIIDKKDTYYFCSCKQSNNKPFCDGSHKKLGTRD
jgi:CDGSH-type Zn-finger protein